MMKNDKIQGDYYEEPLKESVKGLLLSLIFLLLWVLFFSYTYGVFIAFSPLIYINLFICIGFGMALSLGVKVATSLFSVVKKKTILILSVLLGTLGVYLSWAIYILFFISENPVFQYSIKEYISVLNPFYLVDLLVKINTLGVWSIFGVTFTGGVLWLIWLIEALIILLFSVGVSKRIQLYPYSSFLSKKYDKYILDKDFTSMVKSDKFQEAIKSNCVETIDEMGFGKAFYFGKITLFYLPQEITQYISFENVRPNLRGGGEDRKAIITHLKMSTKEAEQLLAKYKNNKSLF